MIDNVIVGKGYKVEVFIIKNLISDINNKFSNIKYRNVVFHNAVVLLDSKFNLISTPLILCKE